MPFKTISCFCKWRWKEMRRTDLQPFFSSSDGTVQVVRWRVLHSPSGEVERRHLGASVPRHLQTASGPSPPESSGTARLGETTAQRYLWNHKWVIIFTTNKHVCNHIINTYYNTLHSLKLTNKIQSYGKWEPWLHEDDEWPHVVVPVSAVCLRLTTCRAELMIPLLQSLTLKNNLSLLERKCALSLWIIKNMIVFATWICKRK